MAEEAAPVPTYGQENARKSTEKIRLLLIAVPYTPVTNSKAKRGFFSRLLQK